MFHTYDTTHIKYNMLNATFQHEQFESIKVRVMLVWTTIFACLLAVVGADHNCICSYAIENAVYPKPDVGSAPVGFLYEFDCAPMAINVPEIAGFVNIVYKEAVYLLFRILICLKVHRHLLFAILTCPLSIHRSN